MNTKETPVKIGIEVEAAYPNVYPNAEVQAACTTYLANAGRRVSGLPSDILGHHHSEEYDQSSQPPRHWAVHPWEKEVLPEQYRSPAGWERGWESQHEFRFRGPADTLRETFSRLDNLKAYFKAWGQTCPSGYGTHVHFGVRDWLQKKWPTYSRGLDTVSGRSYNAPEYWTASPAARLTSAFILSRGTALTALLSLSRRTGGYGGDVSSYGVSGSLYRIHQHWHNNGFGHNASGLALGRKGIPTMEMRIYQGTTETDAIKGWVALNVALIKLAEQRMTEEMMVSFQGPQPPDRLPTDADVQAPTKGFLVDATKYTTDHLKDDIRSLNWWASPLISWIDETLARNGESTPFEGSIHEIYTDDITGTSSTKTSAKKRNATTYEIPERMAVAA